MEEKRKTEASRHALELQQQRLRELELKEKKEKSDEAFKAWLESTAQRTKSLPHSYAKCDGAITGECRLSTTTGCMYVHTYACHLT